MPDKKILVRQEDAVGFITINNPDRRNAISLAMWQDLATAGRDLANNDGCRAVVVRGAGGMAFAAGADIAEFDDKRASASAVEAHDEAVGAACVTSEDYVEGRRAFREGRRPRFLGR